MPVKKWFQTLRPLQLYIFLGLTVALFFIELIISHFTHSLTLLMDSYHMMCKIFALTACLVNIKTNSTKTDNSTHNSADNLESSPDKPNNSISISLNIETETLQKSTISKENKLKNTFGWARIEVILSLLYCVFLASFAFSVVAEASQTLVHINHFDEMHFPVLVFFLGVAGLILNLVYYIVTRSFKFYQGNFLHMTESGDVVFDKIAVTLTQQSTLPKAKHILPSMRTNQFYWDLCRDVIGCIFIMICAAIVYFSDKHFAKYVDPIFSIISAGSLMILSYPNMKASCLILLQTMPHSMDIDLLKNEMLKKFPDVVNIHDFHVWQLTANKIISTIHIIFKNKDCFEKTIDNIKLFLRENGITQITIQPEFPKRYEFLNGSSGCLMQCREDGCRLRHCCPSNESNEVTELPHRPPPLTTQSLPNLKLEESTNLV